MTVSTSGNCLCHLSQLSSWKRYGTTRRTPEPREQGGSISVGASGAQCCASFLWLPSNGTTGEVLSFFLSCIAGGTHLHIYIYILIAVYQALRLLFCVQRVYFLYVLGYLPLIGKPYVYVYSSRFHERYFHLSEFRGR